MIDAGKINDDVGESHPLRHILSRALGIGRSVSPQVSLGQGKPGDLFLLCTDGLTGMIPDEDLEAYLGLHADQDLDSLALELVELANERGGSDNITVVLLRLDG
jgi:protein phosphatase